MPLCKRFGRGMHIRWYAKKDVSFRFVAYAYTVPGRYLLFAQVLFRNKMWLNQSLMHPSSPVPYIYGALPVYRYSMHVYRSPRLDSRSLLSVERFTGAVLRSGSQSHSECVNLVDITVLSCSPGPWQLTTMDSHSGHISCERGLGCRCICLEGEARGLSSLVRYSRSNELPVFSWHDFKNTRVAIFRHNGFQKLSHTCAKSSFLCRATRQLNEATLRPY